MVNGLASSATSVPARSPETTRKTACRIGLSSAGTGRRRGREMLLTTCEAAALPRLVEASKRAPPLRIKAPNTAATRSGGVDPGDRLVAEARHGELATWGSIPSLLSCGRIS